MTCGSSAARSVFSVFSSTGADFTVYLSTFWAKPGVAVGRRRNDQVKSAPVDDKTLKTDLAALLPHVKGAGLVYICNPNNPTATHQQRARRSRTSSPRCKKTSPTTAVLIDEAYCDYVSDPGFQTAIPVALATPGVLVARTFSKAYGMAGVRIGYAIGDAATVEEDGRLQDAVQRQHVRRRRGGRVAQGSAAHQGRERRATRRCATSP